MAGIDNIANALMGFSAGVQGSGGQFLAQQEQKRQKQLEFRRQAALKDIVQAHSLLQSDPTGRATTQLLEGRVKVGEENNIPMNETRQLLDMFKADTSQGAMALNSEMESAVRRGLISPPPSAVKRNIKYENGQIIDLDQGVARPVQGYQAPAQKPETRELKVGDKIITQEFNPDTGRYEDIATAERFNEKSGVNVNVGGNQRTFEEELKLITESKYAEELAKHRAKGVSDRQGEDMANGKLAAEAVPLINRSLELLNDVETGGLSGVALKAKSMLGVESANEAELVNNLSQSILMQIKPLFGAAPSVKEGEWLKQIEASAGMSTEGVRALLNKGLSLAKAKAERGIRAAESARDKRTAEEIRSTLEFTLNDTGEQKKTPGPQSGEQKLIRVKF